MVSPKESWEETEQGYRSGGTEIYILPTRTVEQNGRQYVEVIDDAEEATQWDLLLEYRTHQKEVATFEDPRTAWEFANALTHYISFIGPESGVSDLKRHNGGGGIEGIVEEGRDGEEVYREALGDREYMLDNALEESN